MSILVSLFFCLLSAAASQSTPPAYQEIQRWNASCSPKDTCSVPRDLDDSQDHNCDCSSLCALYDSCCIDSPFLNVSRAYERPASCRQVGQSGDHVFMIDACSTGYAGPTAIRRRCEQTAKNWSDPFNNVPVTNVASQKTYKSLFCALCNGESPRELEMWQLMLDCSALNEYMEVCTENRRFVLDNMMYIREKGLWGLWSWDSKTDWKFRYLPVHFKVPPGLRDLVKECRPKLVSSCPPGWRDARTRRLCQAYMGTVYFSDAAFRNAHCARCNGVTDFSAMSCHETRQSDFRKPTMSFGLLLDIDLRHGGSVGNVDKQCGADEVFDPFSKKCRLIECPLPGFTLKDRKCVPE